MIQTVLLAVAVSAWAIALIRMGRPGGALHVDAPKIFAAARQALARGETINVGYYRLGQRRNRAQVSPEDRVQVARQELEEILTRFASPAAIHADVIDALVEQLHGQAATNFAAEWLATDGLDERIESLSVECRLVRDFGRTVALDGDPLDLAGLPAYA